MPRLLLFTPFAAASLLAGCGVNEPDVTPPETTAAASVETVATWESQFTAVRAGRSDAVRLGEVEVTPAQLQQLGEGCEGLTTLIIDRGSAGEGSLGVLSRLPKLRQLKLPGQVSDAGIKAVSGCRELEILNLPGGVFTDRGCERIARLDQLMLLRFGSPHVTDEGIRAIAEMPRLRFLHLLDVPITDAGLEHVASIETLESFYLDGGRASDDGLRRLIANRPDLHVHLDQTHIPGDPSAHD